MPDVRVSVIMPAFNAEKTVAASLGSLLAQTSRDFEVIVVDDGSVDATVQIVEQVAAEAGVPISLVRSPHGGRAAARNQGIAESHGEYFAFVDSDDAAEPEMLSRMLACVEETGADLVVCEYLGVDATTGAVLHHYPEGDSTQYGGSAAERPGLLRRLSGSVCNKLVHRSLFQDTGIEFPVGRDFEDLATSYRLCGEAKRIEKVAVPLYRYLMGQPASIMRACDERYLHIFDALSLTNDHFVVAGSFDELRADLEVVNFVHSIVGRYDDLFLYGSRAVRREFIDRAFAHMDYYFPGWRRSDDVRSASGRWAKHAVSTDKALLAFYTGAKAMLAR